MWEFVACFRIRPLIFHIEYCSLSWRRDIFQALHGFNVSSSSAMGEVSPSRAFMWPIANCKAVQPPSFCFALLAPAFNKIRRTVMRPWEAAVMSAVYRRLFSISMFALNLSRISAVPSLFSAARYKAVRPYTSCSSKLAPARIKSSTIVS